MATPHAPIVIDSDVELIAMAVAESWPGNGSALDPYVLNDVNISGDGGTCIYIGNTTLHFRIANCELSNSANILQINRATNVSVVDCKLRNASLNGIIVAYSDHILLQGNDINVGEPKPGPTRPNIRVNICNNVTIQSNRLTRGDYGIMAVRSSYCLAEGNDIVNPKVGGMVWQTCVRCSVQDNECGQYLLLHQSNNNTVVDNRIRNSTYGIILEYANDNLIVSNNISNSVNGMSIWFVNMNNRIYQNRMVNCSVVMNYQGLEMFTGQKIHQNNTVNGKPIYHYMNVDMSSTTVPTDAGEVILGAVTNANITGMSFSHGSVGIMAGYSDRLTVQNCQFENMSVAGVDCISTTNVSIRSCTATDMAQNFILLNRNCSYGEMSDNELTRCHVGFRTLNQQGLWGGWVISDNRLTNCWDGFSLSSWHNDILRNTINVTHDGIYLEDSEQNRVFENVISAGITGIGIYNQTDLKVYLNVIEGGRYGIQMDLCIRGAFENNTLSNATDYAVAIWSNTSTGNLFVWNHFIGNNGSNATYRLDHVQAMDLGANRWNLSGSPHGYGNYWSDWTTPSNGSGVVSLPYLLDEGAKDFFPLVTISTVPAGDDTMMIISITLVLVVAGIVAAFAVYKRRK